VEGKLSWLVVWRDIEYGVFNPPGFSDPNDHVGADFVVFVDGATGELLESIHVDIDAYR